MGSGNGGRRWRWGRAAMAALGGAALAGCAGVVQHSRAPQLKCADTFAVLPMENYTETPQAALGAESMAESVLLGMGAKVRRYPASLSQDSLFESGAAERLDKALTWAQGQEIAYGLTGAVDEWRYKAGVDGEPAVGMTLKLVDIQSGRTVWTAAGARTGWGRDAVSGVALKLVRQLLATAAPGC